MVRIVHLFIPRENSSFFSPFGDPDYMAQFYAYMRHVQYLIFISQLFTSLNVAVNSFSTLANIVVVVVFLNKDGFKSTANVSFSALGITDVLVSFIWALYHMTFHRKISKYIKMDRYLTSHVVPSMEILATVSSYITAVITWERLICVAFPLKVSSPHQRLDY
ncbi:chemosensory receptor A [Elysia marginata]|uniref:Chemosensory receptor A n=1 Tax=Elysia marginata TaxID=1093978 RepID=A0AAV4H446_9GAST|nr:chemosensory receptor A [Elysia marginata]